MPAATRRSVQSLLTSSFTFVVLYGALSDPSRAWRTACFLALPLLCVATYYTRPENIIFYPLDLGAILLSSAGAPWRRRALAVALSTVAAVYSVVTRLLVNYGHNVQEGLSLQTLRTAAHTLFSLRFNMLLNPWSNPPGVTLLALVGAVLLWRRGERWRAVFLGTWLLGFFVVHSYVMPHVPAMQARYHLNLVTPMVLLAAAGTPELLRAPRALPYLVALYLLAAPLAHLAFERDADYFEMRELDFLRREVRPRIPPGCTVLEFQPVFNTANPAMTHASRIQRLAERMVDGVSGPAWEVVSTGVMPRVAPLDERGPEAREVLSPAALDVLAHPPQCLLVYEGLTCWSHRPQSTAIAPVCADLRQRLDLVTLTRTRFRANVYDSVNAGRIVTTPDGSTRSIPVLHDGSTVTLSLYHVRGVHPAP